MQALIRTEQDQLGLATQDANLQDFAVGWLVNGSAWGRPVDVKTASDGSLFVSDDGGGKIYRIIYMGVK